MDKKQFQFSYDIKTRKGKMIVNGKKIKIDTRKKAKKQSASGGYGLELI